MKPIMRMATVCLGLFFAGSSAWASPQVSAQLSTQHRNWLDREVRHIISEEEKNYFLNLADDATRERFITAFWKAHDPTPGTVENEFRTEHYRRLAVARSRYGTKEVSGVDSERGRFYIRLGEPVQVVSYNAPQLVSPMEAWLYPPDRSSGIRYNFYVLFYIPAGAKDYTAFCSGVDDPLMLLSRSLPGFKSGTSEWALERLLQLDPLLAQLAISPLPSEHRPIMAGNSWELRRALARRSQVCKKLFQTLWEEQHLDEERGLATILKIMDGEPEPVRDRYVSANVPVWYRYHALRNEKGRPCLYHTFQISPRDIGMRDFYGRCYVLLQVTITASSEGRADISRSDYVSAVYDSWEIFNGGAGPMIYQGTLELPPGYYTVRTEVKNPIDGRSFGFGDAIDIPAALGTRLALSAPVLIREEMPARSGKDDRLAYTFFGRSYMPASANTVNRGHDAIIYYQLFNPQRDRTSTVSVRYAILTNKRVCWNSTDVLHNEDLKPGGFFSHTVVLPIRDLPPGVYTLEISAQALAPPEARTRFEFVISRDREEGGVPVVAGFTR